MSATSFLLRVSLLPVLHAGTLAHISYHNIINFIIYHVWESNLLRQALPNSIKNISENSKNLTPVIEYLEQAYLTASDQQAQADVETQVGRTVMS